MRKNLFLILLYLLFQSFLPFPLPAEKSIKVGVYQNKPLVFIDSGGNASGLSIDILKYIAKKENWKIEYVPGSLQESLLRLEKGEIDMLSVPYSKEMEGFKCVFTNVPVLSNWAQVYTRRGCGIQSIVDLENKSIAGVKNDVYFDELKTLIESFCTGCRFIEMEDYEGVLKFLDQGYADAGVVSILYGTQHERKYRIARTSIMSPPKEIYFALSPGSANLINVIDKHLLALKGNKGSIYYHSLSKWFGSVSRWVFPVWLIWLLVLAASMTLIALAANIILRQEIKKKTEEIVIRNKELAEEIQERKRVHDKLVETLTQLEKRVEERTQELSRSNELLRKEIAERTRAEEKLNATMERLSRSNRELEQFAYAVSHDLKEPLRMVTSYLQLLERRYKDKLDKDAQEFIAFAKEGADRMNILIEDLLAYSRLDTPDKTFKRVDSTSVLNDVLDILKIPIEKSRAEVTYDNLPEVVANPTQLSQLFQNLITNAIKFCTKKPPRVHISAQHKEGEWLFSVQDNGIGIRPEDRERIFVLFQRLHPRDKYSGTGVGLAICKKIVERHGGRIWVESEPGKGSTFYFTIPDKD